MLKALVRARRLGFSDVLFLDSVNKKYLVEVSASNIFTLKGNEISTPPISGTILPGITRKSIIEIALALGFQVNHSLHPKLILNIRAELIIKTATGRGKSYISE